MNENANVTVRLTTYGFLAYVATSTDNIQPHFMGIEVSSPDLIECMQTVGRDARKANTIYRLEVYIGKLLRFETIK